MAGHGNMDATFAIANGTLTLGREERLRYGKERRQRKRDEARRLAAEKREAGIKRIEDTWRRSIEVSKRTNQVQVCWKNFRTIHPMVYALGARLRDLRLNGNQFTHVPRKLAHALPALRILSMCACGIEALPPSIGLLADLRELNLASNRIKWLPDSFCQLTRIETLHLTANHLRSLPAEFGNLGQLTRLDLANNELTTLPASLRRMTKVTEVVLSANRFTTVPDALFQMPVLAHLTMNKCRVAQVPQTMVWLLGPRLRSLKLCANELLDLPNDLAGLADLETLWLEWNGLEFLPDSFRALERLTDLRLDGNPMKWPGKAVVRKGTEGIKAWCKQRYHMQIEYHKRRILTTMQRILEFVADHDLAYRGVFEPHAEWEDERGVLDEYYAMQLDAFYSEFLPAVESHFAAQTKAVPSVLKFDFPREEVFDLIENYMDSSNLPIGRIRAEAMFKKCCCVDENGEPLICVPPKKGWLCLRECTLLKRVISTKSRDDKLVQERAKRLAVRKAEDQASKEARAFVASSTGKKKFRSEAVAAAAVELESGRKKEFVDATLRQFKLDMDIKAEKRDGLRSKLGQSKLRRVEALEIQVMEEQAALPELNAFERTQADKRIAELKKNIAYTPEDAALFDLEMEERADKAAVKDKRAKLLAEYKPMTKLELEAKLQSKAYRLLIDDIQLRNETRYKSEMVKTAVHNVEHEFYVMHEIINRYKRKTIERCFDAWVGHVDDRKVMRAVLKQVSLDRIKHDAETKIVEEQLQYAELQKWERKFDHKREVYYHEHSESKEIIYGEREDLPVRPYIARGGLKETNEGLQELEGGDTTVI